MLNLHTHEKLAHNRIGKQMVRLAILALLLIQTTFAGSTEPAKVAGLPSSEKRVALVIGNAAYQSAPLTNPLNDAEDIAAKLRARGFDVIERKNLKTSQIGRTLREFRSKLSQGSIALVFYAGHGLQIKGENYLPTVDADIEGEEDVPNQSLSVKQLLDVLDESKTRLNLVFLDACRNNPYNRRFRSAGSGLAKETPPSGTLISFATRPGSMAADGIGRNGLYSQHLLQVMDTPNQPVELALKQLVSGVKLASKGQQEPWMEGSIEGEFHFLSKAALSAPPIQTQIPPSTQKETIDRAVDEAMRRTNEQSAKDRAELLASMERLIKEALVRQTAQMEAERRLREKDNVHAASANSTNPPPVTLASVQLKQATAPSSPRKIGGISVGDEWEYVANGRFGKRDRQLILRVKAISSEGTLEEILWDGRKVNEWVFGSQAAAIGTPNESEFLFASQWDGAQFSELIVEGGASMCTSAGMSCKLTVDKISTEKITVPAGTFDAMRIEGWIRASVGTMSINGPFTIWYSQEFRRLLKQSAEVNGRLFKFDETIELSAIRRAAAH
jgi:uncharacterized caspase-like protein